MFPAKFHKPQSARFKFDCEPLNFLPTSPPSNLDFVFFAYMSSPSKTPRAEQGELLADVAGQSIRISRSLANFASHEQQFLAGVRVHPGVKHAEVGEPLPGIARHFVQ
jgi:hypothetical protein